MLEIVYPGNDTTLRRFTQDTPVLPDVWTAFAEDPAGKQQLLLTPHFDSSAHELYSALRARLERAQGQGEPAALFYNESNVLAELDFENLVRNVLPLSQWWRARIWRNRKAPLEEMVRSGSAPDDLADALANPGGRYPGELVLTIRIIGAIEHLRHGGEPPEQLTDRGYWVEVIRHFFSLVDLSMMEGLPEKGVLPLWSVNRNRPATRAVWRSALTIKADAAIRLFDLKCSELRWAVIDSGIDARHPAFRRRDPDNPQGEDGGFPSRVVKTYDFTRLLDILKKAGAKDVASPYHAIDPERFEDLNWRLSKGQAVDWNLLEPFLRVPHNDTYRAPRNEHGTHVAGILAADWRTTDTPAPERDIRGVCPDLELYDLRVLDDEGAGDEFTILAALQFVRHLNSHKDQFVIHGVNLSMSLVHDVRNFACGRTPICEECERLVGSGVVVVAAAGNSGYSKPQAKELLADYHSISITDPGNAESVITVGSTHRQMPHTYGVSYFSSRGPTGDGRPKPDLVAPGEKIESVIPGDDLMTMDGTSMAAPHASGAAALLLARHRELIGQPARVKQILCKTATDLGRDRNFQGAGVLDVLRALQSV
jgi:hypothetical protein